MSRTAHAVRPLKKEIGKHWLLPNGRFAKTLLTRRARREPLPSLEEYTDPLADFWDEDDPDGDDAARAAGPELELIWSDGWLYQRDEVEGYDLCPCCGEQCCPPLTQAEINDYREELAGYDYGDDWGDYE